MGIMRILDHFDMYPLKYVNISETSVKSPFEGNLSGPPNTVLCSRGFWVITKKIKKKKFYEFHRFSIVVYKDGWIIGSLS